MSDLYCGRFAPTPSGPLHLGSLLTALASFLQARAAGGRWLLRIDDLDSPRCVPGADGEIRQQLEAHALTWDGAPRYQSRHVEEYRAALDALQRRGLTYACTCTRAALARSQGRGPDGPIYPGTCRAAPARDVRHALRVRTGAAGVAFDDGWQGRQQRDMAADVGDFVVRRTDGIIAYQLACAVDEAAQGISEVVRGADLLGSTFQQLHVQQLLGLRRAHYRHLPVVVGADGRKLSKQNHALAVRATEAAANLRRCLAWLGQQSPDADSAPTIVAQAIANWDPLAVPARLEVAVG